MNRKTICIFCAITAAIIGLMLSVGPVSLLPL
jgi:hypothetical protein